MPKALSSYDSPFLNNGAKPVAQRLSAQVPDEIMMWPGTIGTRASLLAMLSARSYGPLLLGLPPKASHIIYWLELDVPFSIFVKVLTLNETGFASSNAI